MDVPAFPDLTITEAQRYQAAHSCAVVRTRDSRLAPRTIAGIDVSIRGSSSLGRAVAAIVVMEFPSCRVLEQRTAERPVRFPYVPGYLAFREMPAIVEAWWQLDSSPDVLLVDGHGIAHPKRFGIACVAGLHLGRPSIGCGKSRFVGTHREPGARRGCRTQLVDTGGNTGENTGETGAEVLGAVVRSRDGVKPIYVSIGHGIDLHTAVRITLRCCRGFRLPEPIRAADALAGRADLGFISGPAVDRRRRRP